MMRRLTVSLTIAIMVTLPFTTGCVGRTVARVANAGKVILMYHDLGPTTSQSTGDHLHTMSTILDADARAFFDDLDMLYQMDRPTRLTRWIER